MLVVKKKKKRKRRGVLIGDGVMDKMVGEERNHAKRKKKKIAFSVF